MHSRYAIVGSLRHSISRSELSQRGLTQRDPFVALDTIQRLVRVCHHRHAEITALVYQLKVQRVFMEAMGVICAHKWNDPQTTIDTVYDVRSLSSPEV